MVVYFLNTKNRYTLQFSNKLITYNLSDKLANFDIQEKNLLKNSGANRINFKKISIFNKLSFMIT